MGAHQRERKRENEKEPSWGISHTIITSPPFLLSGFWVWMHIPTPLPRRFLKPSPGLNLPVNPVGSSCLHYHTTDWPSLSELIEFTLYSTTTS